MRDKTLRVSRFDLPGILPSFQRRTGDAEDVQGFFPEAIRFAKSADLRGRDHPCSTDLVCVEQPGGDPLLDYIDFHRTSRELGFAQSMHRKSVELLLAAAYVWQHGFQLVFGNDQAMQKLIGISHACDDFTLLNQGQ